MQRHLKRLHVSLVLMLFAHPAMTPALCLPMQGGRLIGGVFGPTAPCAQGHGWSELPDLRTFTPSQTVTPPPKSSSARHPLHLVGVGAGSQIPSSRCKAAVCGGAVLCPGGCHLSLAASPRPRFCRISPRDERVSLARRSALACRSHTALGWHVPSASHKSSAARQHVLACAAPPASHDSECSSHLRSQGSCCLPCRHFRSGTTSASPHACRLALRLLPLPLAHESPAFGLLRQPFFATSRWFRLCAGLAALNRGRQSAP